MENPKSFKEKLDYFLKKEISLDKLDDFLQKEVHFSKPYLREPASKIPCPECSINIVAKDNGHIHREVRIHMARAHKTK